MVHRLQRREVVVLEDGAASLELAHIALHIIAPQTHLRVIGSVRRGTSVHEERPVPALEEKVIRDGLDGQGQTQHLLVELLATGEVARAEHCGNPVDAHAAPYRRLATRTTISDAES